ncbi:MLX-interacting protein-like isoform X2 [Paramacrobiotus metropolitanus]|uniref:MLX-interacting protein-like isoform X2 n=1 Tax=Paramacrobiotus metropolitanus TaxID=2943436 RepID=UPI002446583C|nr:MLX-interacting protein-like isoform X2 [Paramacrobiotus metropolitanus]
MKPSRNKPAPLTSNMLTPRAGDQAGHLQPGTSRAPVSTSYIEHCNELYGNLRVALNALPVSRASSPSFLSRKRPAAINSNRPNGREIVHSGHFMNTNVGLEDDDNNDSGNATDSDSDLHRMGAVRGIKPDHRSVNHGHPSGQAVPFGTSTSLAGAKVTGSRQPECSSSVHPGLQTGSVAQVVSQATIEVPDASLAEIFQRMTLNDRTKLTSPKWNNLEGLKLRWNVRLRWNNLIWRAWHMQFVKRAHSSIAPFSAATDDAATSSAVESVSALDKYWKSWTTILSLEYSYWRLWYKNPSANMTQNSKLPMYIKQFRAADWRQYIKGQASSQQELPYSSMLVDDFDEFITGLYYMDDNANATYPSIDIMMGNAIFPAVDVTNIMSAFNFGSVTGVNITNGGNPMTETVSQSQWGTALNQPVDFPAALFTGPSSTRDSSVCNYDPWLFLPSYPYPAEPNTLTALDAPPTATTSSIHGPTLWTNCTGPVVQYPCATPAMPEIPSNGPSTDTEMAVPVTTPATPDADMVSVDFESSTSGSSRASISKRPARGGRGCRSAGDGRTRDTGPSRAEFRMINQLYSLMPSLSEKASYEQKLLRAARHIRQLKKDRQSLPAQVKKIQEQIDEIRKQTKFFEQTLPATGAVVNSSAKLNAMLDEHIRKQTMQNNWKYWMFSLIIRPLFNSYLKNVTSNDAKGIGQNVVNWTTQCFTLEALRPLNSQSLETIMMNTSVLTDPTRVPEEARQLAVNRYHGGSERPFPRTL